MIFIKIGGCESDSYWNDPNKKNQKVIKQYEITNKDEFFLSINKNLPSSFHSYDKLDPKLSFSKDEEHHE